MSFKEPNNKRFEGRKERKIINIDDFLVTHLLSAQIYGEDSVENRARDTIGDAYKDFTKHKRKVIKKMKENCYGTSPRYYEIIEEELENFINICMDRAFLMARKARKSIMDKYEKQNTPNKNEGE